MTERTVDYSHLGVGQFYFRQRGAGQPFMPLGNAEQVQFGIETNSIDQPEFRRPGGGMRQQIERITNVTLSFTAYDLSPRNIAAVLYGDRTSTVEGTLTEALTAYVGGFLPLTYPDPSEVKVYADEAGSPATAAMDAEGNYTVEDGGLWIYEDAPDITDGDTIHVEYTHGASNMVEALMHSGHEFEGSFRGYNEARSKPFSVDVFRYRFQPTEELGLISEEFTQLSMQARVLSDQSKGENESAFFRLVMPE